MIRVILISAGVSCGFQETKTIGMYMTLVRGLFILLRAYGSNVL